MKFKGESLRALLFFLVRHFYTYCKLIYMGTEYTILFAPNVGGLAIIRDDEQVWAISDEEIDTLIKMLEEEKGS
jgi:hypothetical protein